MELKIGDSVTLNNTGEHYVDGVIVNKNEMIIWGHTIEVQIVNGNLLHPTGSIEDFRPQDLTKIDKCKIK